MDKNITYKSAPTSDLQGEIRVPGDKSMSHRAILLAAIATGTSQINGFLMGTDNLATLTALQQLGVPVVCMEDEARVSVAGVGMQGLTAAPDRLDLGNSGTGVRLLAGLLAAQSFDSELTGDVSLRARPMKRIVAPLQSMGAKISLSQDDRLPLKIKGPAALSGIHYALPIASAQVKSSLLLAGLYAEGTTTLIEPAPTRDHTERLLQAFGYPVHIQGNKITVKGGGQLRATCIDIPADMSSAAFFIVAATITPHSSIILKEVGVNPRRMGMVTLLQHMGADIKILSTSQRSFEPTADIQVNYSPLKGMDIPIEQVPLAIDELPILMIAAACAEGTTLLRGAQELRVKETDRIAAMATGLEQLGIQAKPLPDGIRIEGGTFQGGEINSYGDHRIAMAFAIAGCVANAPVMVRNCDHVATSFPNFVAMGKKIGMQFIKIQRRGY